MLVPSYFIRNMAPAYQLLTAGPTYHTLHFLSTHSPHPSHSTLSLSSLHSPQAGGGAPPASLAGTGLDGGRRGRCGGRPPDLVDGGGAAALLPRRAGSPSLLPAPSLGGHGGRGAGRRRGTALLPPPPSIRGSGGRSPSLALSPRRATSSAASTVSAGGELGSAPVPRTSILPPPSPSRGGGSRARALLSLLSDTATDTYPNLSFKAHCGPVRRYAMDTYPRRIRIRYVSDTGYVVSWTYQGNGGCDIHQYSIRLHP